MRFTDASRSILVLAIATSLCACSGEKQADGAVISSVPEFPAAQQAFHALNKSCDEAYDAGQNEIQKSMAFNSCNQQRTQFASGQQISGWTGTISDISTDQGADVVTVDIEAEVDGFETRFQTVNNRISDMNTGSMITQDSPLFNVLAQMKEGDKVSFDAQFLRHPEGQRGIWENSLTEQGSMSEPVFNVRFTDIRPFGSSETRRAAGAGNTVAAAEIAPAAVAENSPASQEQDSQYCSNIYRNASGDGVTAADISKYRSDCPGQDLPPTWEDIEAATRTEKVMGGSVKPSFDCKKASTTVEHLICSNSELARLDSDLARAYSIARSKSSGSQKDQIVFTQKRWGQDERNGCGEDVECMKATYEDRISLLESL